MTMVHISLWVLAGLIILAALFGGALALVAVARAFDGSSRR
jgi:hypothetical protein